MGVELGVEERLFHQTLAVIEHAVHLQRGDVAPEGSELTLLDATDFPFGIEHIDVYALHAEEAVGNGRTSVATGGYEHVHAAGILLADEILQQSCHEAGAYVLECQGGAVEKFQGVNVLVNLGDGAVEGQSVAYDAAQVFYLYILAEESLCHSAGYLLE